MIPEEVQKKIKSEALHLFPGGGHVANPGDKRAQFIKAAEFGYSLRANEERWVRVEEELPQESDATDPEDSTRYLTMPHYRVLPFFEERFWFWNSDLEDYYTAPVTHWQPLPSAPSV